MRRIGLLISSFLVLNAATEIHQFFKLPALLSHYRHHRQENPAMSFLDFLRLHYHNDHPKDGDQDEDNQLPFRSVGTVSHIDLNWTPHTEISRPVLTPATSLFVTHSSGSIIRRSFGVFHPPRFA